MHGQRQQGLSKSLAMTPSSGCSRWTGFLSLTIDMRPQVARSLVVQEALAKRLLGPAEYYRLGPPLAEEGDKPRWETRSAR